jgi:phosphoribosyl-AMP cyclohydrolase
MRPGPPNTDSDLDGGRRSRRACDPQVVTNPLDPESEAGQSEAGQIDAARLSPAVADRLRRTGDGLVAAIVQDDRTEAVLMLAWMNDEALARTMATGRATYYSRSRQSLWVKGETSGNRQWVRSIAVDCDGDAVLLRVHQEGPACHTGATSCFTGRELPLGRASASTT